MHAMDTTHKIEHRVRDLNTLSVTLFPSRAQISREIKSVQLKPGTNEITVTGLSPTVDEDSIKVEGNGAATITDIAVELVPNREIFDEIYPESDEESSDSDESDVEDSDQEDADVLAAAKAHLTDLEDELALVTEKVASAHQRLRFLDDFGKTLDRKRNVVIEESLATYKEQRAEAFEEQFLGFKKQRILRKSINKALGEVARLKQQEDKKRAKAGKEKEKLKKEKAKKREMKRKKKEEARKERQRARAEKQKFWPTVCYSVKITLEAAAFTPSSSRRASIASGDVDVSKLLIDVEDKSEAVVSCDLVLSYVTTSAYWSPSYDLQLSTTSATASLYFDAMLRNFTCETWANCKVTLSTSQTTFSGLEDAIPTLLPWRIKLGGKQSGVTDNDILKSKEEVQFSKDYKNWQKQNNSSRPLDRAQMFGQQQQGQMDQIRHFHQSMRQMQAAPPPPPPPPAAAAAAASTFTRIPAHAKVKRATPEAGGGGVSGANISSGLPFIFDSLDQADDQTLAPDVDFQESLMEETGLTTTYDLPGLKTLAPKSTASKQRVARVHFANVVFSHTVVAKYKPVAYLRAKVRNSSKLTLLKGPAGLTLDGTFMGKTSLPRCSAGESFGLSLGVDPAIRVSYPKPDVRRTSSGLFSKENSSVYVRVITLHNTRAAAGRAVSMLVLDQVPVSEDERLRVDLVEPRIAKVEGEGPAEGVVAGAPGREGKEDREWGRATAKMKKGGVVSWDVRLDAGKAVKLVLEYAVSMPSGDVAQQVGRDEERRY